MKMKSYDHTKIEKKWQKEWETSGIYRANEEAGKEKMYVLDMFPYPSGDGLHVGHPKGYIATDVVSRHARMQGKSVLHPMGWDAFGLPAENYAIKNKVHPRVAVEKNVARFKEQLKLIGLDYDWSREINTTDPEFYTWTQWIFLKLFEKGLAYESFEPINWCPSCQTGLANEDLEGNACERCGTIVEKRPMRQWTLKITEYAERLLQDLELLPEWQEHIKESQRNWIGRSEGAEIEFPIEGTNERLKIFTTRPDTIFGATYMVIAPEHPWLLREVSSTTSQISNKDQVVRYINDAKNKTEIERQENKEKSGVKLEGVMALNPATKERIPIYVADYVLANYGTGAIMAVPAHDERDYAFAKKFDLPIRQVVEPRHIGTEEGTPKEGEPFVRRNAVAVVVHNPKDDTYLCVNWKGFNTRALITGGVEDGEDIVEAAKREVQEETGYKNLKLVWNSEIANHVLFYHRVKKVNRWARFQYVFFELENDDRDSVSAEEEALHEVVWVKRADLANFFSVYEGRFILQLLDQGDYTYTGNGVLYNSEEFSWMDSEEARQKITEKYGIAKTTYKIRDWVFSRQRYWGEPIPIIHCEKDGIVPVPYDQLPVRLPEVEHYEPTGTGESPLANIAEWVNTTCPKCGGPAKRETNTMPQWAGSSWYYLRYMDPNNSDALVDPKKEKHWAPVDLYVGGAEHATRHLIYARFWHKFLFDIGVVSTPEPFSRLISVGLIQAEDGRKMSKRFGNVINPDDIVETYGADTLRVYEMFMGPFSDAIAWKTSSLIGARRFLERVWKLQSSLAEASNPEVSRELNRTIKKVGEDIANFKFNTAISQMMIFVNTAEDHGITKAEYAKFISLLAPFAPHIAEDLWHELGNTDSVHVSAWPAFDASNLEADSVTMVVQINGKVRAQFDIARGAGETEAREAAEKAAEKWLQGPTIKKAVFVRDRLVNFVLDA